MLVLGFQKDDQAKFESTLKPKQIPGVNTANSSAAAPWRWQPQVTWKSNDANRLLDTSVHVSIYKDPVSTAVSHSWL